MSSESQAPSRGVDQPAYRYTAGLAQRIEADWQQRWAAEGTFLTPNPVGPLSTGFERVADRPKLFIMDMFPYPSGAGLHVGHPLGYIGTDVYARFKRMSGHNVLQTMGYDAFGLPAEQYAVQTGTHPRVTTEANIANMRRQLGRLGLAHDPRRSVATTDTDYYRWTQWIFLQVFGAWFDEAADKARPIRELEAELASGARPTPDGRPWAELDEAERRQVIDGHRLAYRDLATVNWCPALGTVLANEEVSADGRSDRGDHPVYRRPMKQWMMRITAYADRLLADLDRLDWPEAVKVMQRNWIGRSTGALIDFPVPSATPGTAISVFTTRPDTIFGATYMVLAPEQGLVGQLVPEAWPASTSPAWTGGFATPAEAVAAYRKETERKSELQRSAGDRDKTGVFVGAFATNPANGEAIPVFIADYVLVGYGTGAIMAVPGQDERDWDFAERFELPILRTVAPPQDFEGRAYLGDGPAINSGFLDGLGVEEAKAAIITWLEERGAGKGTVTYKLRDWLFSRQRYWGEPFPIVYDERDVPLAVPETTLPVTLPDLDDWAPRPAAEDSEPEPPLGRVAHWSTVDLDLGDGPKRYRRELNTMPQWAGSCWYYLRYLDPTNADALVDPANEAYWLAPRRPGDTGGVDLYVGGMEHAVLHLLYARFWHKVLHDLGHVSSEEPFHRLLNQGYIQAFAYRDERGFYVEAGEVTEADGRYLHDGRPVAREYGKMGKSLRNSVSPDEIYAAYGADTLRLYEMSSGPLDQSRPWNTRDIVGVHRLLQRTWRLVVDEATGAVTVGEEPAGPETRRFVHRTIAAVRESLDGLRANVAIARLTELVNHLTARAAPAPREAAEPMVLMMAPLAPHLAEELWRLLGHPDSLTWATFPEADPAELVDDQVEIGVSVDGKPRAKVLVAAGADETAYEIAARKEGRVASLLDGRTVRKVVVVPGRLVNFVLG
ncbi:MAG: leucine--tRNA ligase [Acidimicrobiia bacterium]|nr:leucine--tRNA ligase [Acidimicrobiia bacterium]